MDRSLDAGDTVGLAGGAGPPGHGRAGTADVAPPRQPQAALAAFVVFVIAGYLVPLPWTGLTGNTAWDWIKLLLLPALLPIVVMPRLLKAAEEWMAGEANP
jgi:hypothetical protein